MIDVEHLSYTYPGSDCAAVHDIGFRIAPGEIFGFLGPSGSGKSTTQKILFGLLPGYSGSAKISGKEVRLWDKSLYEKIGVGFELPNHYLKLSALENLNFFGAFYRDPRDAMELLDLVGLEQFAHRKVGEFSKGMKMRLNFIRALIHNPDILFLDEPTSGLDPVNARLIKNIILDLRQQGKTIFITTHQMYDADELCDRVAFLAGGRIMALDTPENLKRQGSNRTLEVKLKDNPVPFQFPLDKIGQNAGFLSLIANEQIEAMHSQEATLDDIFIRVTGKTLT